MRAQDHDEYVNFQQQNPRQDDHDAEELDQRFTTIASNIKSEATLEYVRPRSRAQRDVEDAVAKERNPIIKHNKTLVVGTARN